MSSDPPGEHPETKVEETSPETDRSAQEILSRVRTCERALGEAKRVAGAKLRAMALDMGRDIDVKGERRPEVVFASLSANPHFQGFGFSLRLVVVHQDLLLPRRRVSDFDIRLQEPRVRVAILDHEPANPGLGIMQDCFVRNDQPIPTPFSRKFAEAVASKLSPELFEDVISLFNVAGLDRVKCVGWGSPS